MLQHEVRGHPAGGSSVRHVTPRDKLGCQAPSLTGPSLNISRKWFLVFCHLCSGWLSSLASCLRGLGGDAVHSACSALMLWCSKGKHQQTLGPGCLPCKGPSPSVRFLAPRFRSVVFHFQWCWEWNPGCQHQSDAPLSDASQICSLFWVCVLQNVKA